MSRGNLVFRVIVGGYLAYLGFFQLLADAVTKKPDHYIWFILAGAAFGAIGLFWAGRSLLMLFKMKDEDPGESEAETAEEKEVIKVEETAQTIEEIEEEREKEED